MTVMTGKACISVGNAGQSKFEPSNRQIDVDLS